MSKHRLATARERIAWGSPVIVLGGDCKAADPAIANGKLLAPSAPLDRHRRKCKIGETVAVEMVEGLGGRSLQDIANGPCMDPLKLFLPEGKISEAEWQKRQRDAAREAGC